MRRIDWIMIIALVVLAVGGKLYDFEGSATPSPNPRRPSPQAFEPKFWGAETQAWINQRPDKSNNQTPKLSRLPKIGVIEESAGKGSSVGSAFSISDRGLWLTARHVAMGCTKTLIQTGDKTVLRVSKIDFHPSADVALLTTRGAPAPLRLVDAPITPNHAFGVGFPKGKPGAVHGLYIGEMTMHHRGRNGFRERVYAWSERSRIPGQSGSLGGLSGGAVLNSQGDVIGIVQAESRRRGRFMTARPEIIDELLKLASAKKQPAVFIQSEPSLSSDSYPESARQLITSLRVAKVLCIVD